MTKILILGANGFIGRKILSDLLSVGTYNLYACSRTADIKPEKGYVFTQLDITNDEELNSYLSLITPDIIINAAAISSLQDCELNRSKSLNVNVDSVKLLIEYARQNSVFFIHLSTDFVFNGYRKKLYTENDTPDPLNFYGHTKARAEELIVNSKIKAAVLRVEVVYGEPLEGQHGNIFTLVRDKLSKGEIIKVVDDQYRTPTFVDDVCIAVRLVIKKETEGIFHIAGPEYLSISDFAFRIARYYGYNENNIQVTTTRAIGDNIERPRYSGLSIQKARKRLGYNPKTILKSLEILTSPENIRL
ncbi:MAG: SDR family oxidoreductase [Bacteroidales bacterium]